MAGVVDPWRGPERAAHAAAELVVLGRAGGERATATPSRWLRLKPPVLALALGTAALALHALVQGTAVPWAQSLAGGVLVLLAGFGWMGWAWSLFRAAGNPLPPTARPAVLVDEGPYRVGRNPMYLGITAMMLGLGVAAGVPLMAVAAANFVVIVNAVHIPHEEANLRRAFGGWYSDYAASVRRWL